MTNDEAIYTLKNTAWLGWDKQKEKVTEAVRMAVEALKRETSGDAISKQGAIDICNIVIDLWQGQLGEGALVAIKNAINNLPSAQPEIIKCKDCKWYSDRERMCNDLMGFGRYWKPDDFCSYGKRRTNEL